ncbi:hypothetical protein [Arsenicibacter rosenii]|uniref:Uncharacterized protein n=1 Tax=Arsenicibacter rosenii TaxID=1750698 RepID=A0A1S2VK53_9BACT|nr:hypothetical protein [Arsenicibacter rosenii]OIN58605.1 hypothetical protein BLX24_13625 [Arsenicibacter rosenii]
MPQPFDWASGLPVTPFPHPSPFLLSQLADTRTLVHAVDLATYRAVIQSSGSIPDSRFFQQLSEHLAQDGWQTIHLWEDVWQTKPTIVRSRLQALTGQSERIPARLTQVQRIDRPTLDQFLTTHHLQVPTQSKYKYGLFLPKRYFRVLSPDFRMQYIRDTDDELLVAVATFSFPRSVTRHDQPFRSYEMVRFANHLFSTVVGGLDKLLKAFIADQYSLHPPAEGHPLIDVMTYADRDWSDGRSYERLGFERVGMTVPQPFWLDPAGNMRYYPHRLPEGLTEAGLPGRGFIPIVNAGSIKFIKPFYPN